MKQKITYRNTYSGATFVLIGDEEIQKRMTKLPSWLREEAI